MARETIQIPTEDIEGTVPDLIKLLTQFGAVVQMARMLAAFYHGLRLEGIEAGVATALTAALQETLFLQGVAANQEEAGEDETCKE